MGILKERRMVARDVQVGGICDACGGAISLLNEEVENLADAAFVTLQGWYGGAIDPIAPYESLLCSPCTDSMMMLFFPADWKARIATGTGLVEENQ